MRRTGWAGAGGACFEVHPMKSFTDDCLQHGVHVGPGLGDNAKFRYIQQKLAKPGG